MSKQLGAIFAAMLVAILALGPSIDSLICKDGDGFSASAAESAAGHVLADEIDTSDHGADAAGVCVHGHCHHAAPYTPPIQSTAATFAVSRADLAVAPDDETPINRPNLLIRPPRG